MATRTSVASQKRAAASAKHGGRSRKRPNGQSSVTIRHYCQGIGDCHLLRFAKADGSPFTMLIDCGVHSSVKGGREIVDKIVADIAAETDRIDVLVLTHEHWDHVSGFLSAQDQFKKLKIGQIWAGWTEDPEDPDARKLDTFKGAALSALQGARQSLGRGRGPAYLGKGLDALLGFNFGAAGERVRSARDAALSLAPDRVTYLEPQSKPLRIDGLDNLRVYVLGPPRDTNFLRVTERAGEQYHLSAFGGAAMLRALASSLSNAGASAPQDDGDIAVSDQGVDELSPFSPKVGLPLDETLDAISTDAASSDADAIHDFLVAHYAGPAATRTPGDDPDQSWRRIDQDWLGLSADLAMQLDRFTNNTCLVLAFEFVDSGRVLLFPGDAQVGSWLSWQDLTWGKGEQKVTGPDLLSRTVYYKVGHHGSHNATLKAKGLELMANEDLAAFIPTNEDDARKVGWGEMPFKGILKDLSKRTRGRVIRADDKWLKRAGTQTPLKTPSGAIKKMTRAKDGLWVELEIG